MTHDKTYFDSYENWIDNCIEEFNKKIQVDHNFINDISISTNGDVIYNNKLYKNIVNPLSSFIQNNL